MNESKFKTFMEAAQSLGGDYATGYQRGLRRLHHGEKFGTDEEHEKWFNLSGHRAEMGRGYQDGFAGSPPDGFHGNLGNSNAAKDSVNDTFLHIACKSSEKAAWVKAANGKLAPWVIKTLNEAVKNTAH